MRGSESGSAKSEQISVVRPFGFCGVYIYKPCPPLKLGEMKEILETAASQVSNAEKEPISSRVGRMLENDDGNRRAESQYS
jgi:hypothetical protein